MKYIALSADDFARSHERNVAIDYAFKNKLIESAAILINSDFTEEALEMSLRGEYISKLHCHLNLFRGERSGYSRPLDDDIKRSSAFCENGEFKDADVDYFKQNFWNFFSASKICFKELELQYLKFGELTQNKGNVTHLDFHWWYNLNVPVAFAVRKLIKKYGIKSFRFIGEHHFETSKKRLFFYSTCCLISRPFGCSRFMSSNIDYYLSNIEKYRKCRFIELYVHPDLREDKVIDNSGSLYGHEIRKLEENIRLITQDSSVKLVSWNQVDKENLIKDSNSV